jgi:hypothetical protein
VRRGGGRKDKVFVRANKLRRPNKLIKEEAMYDPWPNGAYEEQMDSAD